MLVPAVLYKEEILKEFKKRYYTEDLFYEVGGLHNYCPQIADEPSEQIYQFAILDQDKLVGYFAYEIKNRNGKRN